MAATPADRWREEIAGYRRQCQEILRVSKTVRYAGVVNEYGRTLTGIIRPGSTPMLKSEQVKNEFFVVSMMMSLRSGSAESLGRLEHVVLRHTNVSIVVIQKKRGASYFVSVGNDEADLPGLIARIKRAV